MRWNTRTARSSWPPPFDGSGRNEFAALDKPCVRKADRASQKPSNLCGRGSHVVVIRMLAVAWFRPEDYVRIRDMSDDEMFDTFEEWEKAMERRLRDKLPPDHPFEKVILDPDELLAFAADRYGGKINGEVRSALAAIKIAQKYDRPAN